MPSILASTAGSSLTPDALTFSRTCSGLPAPTIAAETFGFCSVHATANCDRVSPASSATGRSCWTRPRIASVRYSAMKREPLLSVAREPAGGAAPGRYFPVSAPCAIGDQTIWPIPSFSHNGTISDSITRQIMLVWCICRSSSVYCLSCRRRDVTAERGVDRLACLVVRIRHQPAVDPHREAGIVVADVAGDGNRVDATSEQPGDERVPQHVEAEITGDLFAALSDRDRDASGLECWLPVTVVPLVAVDHLASRSGEHQAGRLGPAAWLLPRQGDHDRRVQPDVLRKPVGHLFGQRDRTLLAALGRGEAELARDDHDLTAYPYSAAQEVDISDRQPQHLALSHAQVCTTVGHRGVSGRECIPDTRYLVRLPRLHPALLGLRRSHTLHLHRVARDVLVIDRSG